MVQQMHSPGIPGARRIRNLNVYPALREHGLPIHPES